MLHTASVSAPDSPGRHLLRVVGSPGWDPTLPRAASTLHPPSSPRRSVLRSHQPVVCPQHLQALCGSHGRSVSSSPGRLVPSTSGGCLLWALRPWTKGAVGSRLHTAPPGRPTLAGRAVTSARLPRSVQPQVLQRPPPPSSPQDRAPGPLPGSARPSRSARSHVCPVERRGRVPSRTQGVGLEAGRVLPLPAALESKLPPSASPTRAYPPREPEPSTRSELLCRSAGPKPRAPPDHAPAQHATPSYRARHDRTPSPRPAPGSSGSPRALRVTLFGSGPAKVGSLRPEQPGA